MIWSLLAFTIVAATKYLTSLRLRNLRERIHRDQRDAEELKRTLDQAAEKETELKTQTDQLVSKATALQNIVSNLERSLQKSRSEGQKTDTSS